MPSDPKAASPRPFDVTTIEHLIDLMAKHELGEITLIEGDQRIRLRKNVAATALPAFQAQPQAAMPALAPTAAPVAPAKAYHEIKSPMVGTFYSKPAPDKPDYVALGGKVGVATIVCKVEAMKIFNDIAAEINGTIVEVCVKNSQPVDYGTVLFRVDLA